MVTFLQSIPVSLLAVMSQLVLIIGIGQRPPNLPSVVTALQHHQVWIPVRGIDLPLPDLPVHMIDHRVPGVNHLALGLGINQVDLVLGIDLLAIDLQAPTINHLGINPPVPGTDHPVQILTTNLPGTNHPTHGIVL